MNIGALELKVWLIIKKMILYLLYKRTGEEYVLLSKKVVQSVKTSKGDLFYSTEDLGSVHEVYTDYDLEGFDPHDVVLDIGANIGGFAIYAAKRAKRVYAVEPVRVQELKSNIVLNELNNIEVLEGAIAAQPGPIAISWGSEKKEVSGWMFKQILQRTGPVDFLKCDCEGGEWSIDPEDLIPIRRIEMELHRTSDFNKKYPELLKMLSSYFDFKQEFKREYILIHATKKIKK